MADVHQCPACELKFLNRTELDYHWAEEHQKPAEFESEPGEVPPESDP